MSLMALVVCISKKNNRLIELAAQIHFNCNLFSGLIVGCDVSGEVGW